MKNITFKMIAVFSKENNNLSTLSAIQKQQLIYCADLYFGEEEAAEIDMNNMENLFSEEEERWFEAHFYHVIDEDTKEIIFDFWCYNTDSGTLFMHNSIDYAGFEMIQFSINLIETNEFNEQYPETFAENLDKAFRKQEVK